MPLPCNYSISFSFLSRYKLPQPVQALRKYRKLRSAITKSPPKLLSHKIILVWLKYSRASNKTRTKTMYISRIGDFLKRSEAREFHVYLIELTLLFSSNIMMEGVELLVRFRSFNTRIQMHGVTHGCVGQGRSACRTVGSFPPSRSGWYYTVLWPPRSHSRPPRPRSHRLETLTGNVARGR